MKTSIISRATGRISRSFLFSKKLQRFLHNKANIIYYHGIWKKNSPELMYFSGIDIDTLKTDLELLSKYFEFVNLDTLLRYNIATYKTERPLLVVTFDDGFNLIKNGVSKILKSYGISATSFIATSTLNNNFMLWQHKLQAVQRAKGKLAFMHELNNHIQKFDTINKNVNLKSLMEVIKTWPISKKEAFTTSIWETCRMPPVHRILQDFNPYFNWQTLENWINSGHMVGFHTHTHPFYSSLTDKDLKTEILKPAYEMINRLHIERLPFAYPFGERPSMYQEAMLATSDLFSCLLGIRGLSPRHTNSFQLERAGAEVGIDDGVFGRTILRSFLRIN